jgi:hypothetical protein
MFSSTCQYNISASTPAPASSASFSLPSSALPSTCQHCICFFSSSICQSMLLFVSSCQYSCCCFSSSICRSFLASVNTPSVALLNYLTAQHASPPVPARRLEMGKQEYDSRSAQKGLWNLHGTTPLYRMLHNRYSRLRQIRTSGGSLNLFKFEAVLQFRRKLLHVSNRS